MTFFNRNIKYKHFAIFNEITKLNNKINAQIEKTLRLLISIKCNICYRRII